MDGSHEVGANVPEAKRYDFSIAMMIAGALGSSASVIAIISDSDDMRHMAAIIAERWQNAKVRLLSTPPVSAGLPGVVKTPVSSIDDVFNAIAAGPAPDIIVDDAASRSFGEFGLFKRLFLALNDGGRYVALDADVEHLAAQAEGSNNSTQHWLSELREPNTGITKDPWASAVSKAIDESRSVGPHLVITKRGRHLTKINNLLHREGGESRVEGCVNRRSGQGAVERIASIPGHSWNANSDFETTDADYAARYLKDSYSVRELVAKVYRGPVVAPRQVITMDGLLLPESSMQPLVRPMTNRFITDAGPDFAWDPRLEEEPGMLSGTYFYLDNEYPGHYGHFTSQDLTKLWAWDDALRYDPNCKILISPPPQKPDLNPYQYELLRAFGISRDQVTLLSAPMRVEKLIVSTFALQNPYFASPVCLEIWGKIRDRLMAEAARDLPKRVFIGRSRQLRRRCLNSDEVESVFRSHGFEIVYPENLGIADQIALFSQAEAVAGYAGSGMFTMAYSQNHPTWIVIGSRSYTATTEYLLANLHEDPIRYAMCDPEIEQPVSGWSSDAYFSNYSFNFERDGRQLESMLARL